MEPEDEDGGDAACWAHLLCPECGAVLDGGEHADGCSLSGVAPEDLLEGPDEA